MALHSNSKELNLVLSSDAKPRLKWTPELHRRFIDAIKQLGGAESSEENQRSHFTSKISDGSPEHINESSQIAQALQMQMEVQRKLHEQIEVKGKIFQVQRHLQLRIEAQGKYLQSVLEKAQETISGYSSCSIEVEQAKAQLSQLKSMVDSGCPSSSFSVLTESEGSILKDAKNKLLGNNGCSLESSLTSSENSERNEETPSVENYTLDNSNKGKRKSVVLSLMEMQSGDRKKSRSTIDDEVNHSEQSTSKKATRNIDLNCESLNDFDSGPEVIDLNSKGIEHLNGNF
ncbi:hypothetical protein RD792_012492 [Penstemon davidsonii]|uniref:MYB-CC type transcription factor LHEQLE-containing domain-containing protein n=1 Tax=Penstemon davidsonii TaxID=160366 RepID=A0ABR0CX07_9LAMI|nr:hypothetical protein RD792_012492 [Penstemon davidsonii]